MAWDGQLPKSTTGAKRSSKGSAATAYAMSSCHLPVQAMVGKPSTAMISARTPSPQAKTRSVQSPAHPGVAANLNRFQKARAGRRTKTKSAGVTDEFARARLGRVGRLAPASARRQSAMEKSLSAMVRRRNGGEQRRSNRSLCRADETLPPSGASKGRGCPRESSPSPRRGSPSIGMTLP